MHDQLAFSVPLDLRDIMRHIVHDVHAERLSGTAEYGAERLPDLVRDHLPIRKGAVGGTIHPREVVLTFGRSERRAGKLLIFDREAVLPHGFFKHLEIVTGDLMTESA